jgi:hypothetical protein
MTFSPRYLSVCLLALSPWLARGADELPTDWIDPDTGHRIIRLSTEPGSSTLYFHDNSYSPQGDKLIFNTPSGIALLDITTLGQAAPKPEIAVQGGRGSAMARRSREIYFSRGGNFSGRGGRDRGGAGGQGAPGSAPSPEAASAVPAPPPAPPEVFAYNIDTKETRKISYATRSLISADETFTLATIAAEDPTGNTPKPAFREPKPQLERMFPGKKLEELTPEQQYAVNKEDAQRSLLAHRLRNRDQPTHVVPVAAR